MNVTLERFCHFDYGTLGKLFVGDFECFTLECPWKDNAVGESCIPEGVYDVAPDEEGRYTGYPELQAVPGRTEIIIHPANWVHQIQGCIAPGDSFRVNASSVSVGSSRLAWGKLIATAGKNFQLTVTTRRAVLIGS